MSEVEQLDRDLGDLADEGWTVTAIKMSRARRRRLVGELMAAYGTTAVSTLLADTGHSVERYRDIPLVVVDDPDDNGVVYGLQR